MTLISVTEGVFSHHSQSLLRPESTESGKYFCQILEFLTVHIGSFSVGYNSKYFTPSSNGGNDIMRKLVQHLMNVATLSIV